MNFHNCHYSSSSISDLIVKGLVLDSADIVNFIKTFLQRHETGEFVKKQQCKKATRVKRFNSYSGQRWKLEDLEEGKAHQLWKKGDFDAENYFYLENSGVPKVLTAIPESSLEIKGNRTS